VTRSDESQLQIRLRETPEPDEFQTPIRLRETRTLTLTRGGTAPTVPLVPTYQTGERGVSILTLTLIMRLSCSLVQESVHCPVQSCVPFLKVVFFKTINETNALLFVQNLGTVDSTKPKLMKLILKFPDLISRSIGVSLSTFPYEFGSHFLDPPLVSITERWTGAA